MTTGLISPSTNIKELLAKNPLVENLAMPLANTEYSYAAASNLKRITIKSRNHSVLKVAYTSGESGTIYITLAPGSVYEEINIDGTFTLYVQASKPNEVLEIVTWKKA